MKPASYILIALAALVLILVCICLFKRVCVAFAICKKRGEKISSSLEIRLLNGKVIKKITAVNFKKKKKPEKKSEAEKAEGEEAEEEIKLLDRIKKIYGTFFKIKCTYHKSKDKLRKKVLLDKIKLSVDFGTGNAAYTGIATGHLWAAVYNVIALMSRFASIREPKICINPNFSETILEFEYESIITLRLADIISILAHVGINYYIINKKISKGKGGDNYGRNTYRRSHG